MAHTLTSHVPTTHMVSLYLMSLHFASCLPHLVSHVYQLSSVPYKILSSHISRSLPFPFASHHVSTLFPCPLSSSVPFTSLASTITCVLISQVLQASVVSSPPVPLTLTLQVPLDSYPPHFYVLFSSYSQSLHMSPHTFYYTLSLVYRALILVAPCTSTAWSGVRLYCCSPDQLGCFRPRPAGSHALCNLTDEVHSVGICPVSS